MLGGSCTSWLSFILQQTVVEHSSGPRSFHMGGADKVSIKAQVVFDTCWRKLEDSLQAAGKVPPDVQPPARLPFMLSASHWRTSCNCSRTSS